ncbi:diphosphomevalonate decarboxylase [Patescibacteria group bacterium]|nr:diphosphomevalonate decarboxylase [Patescibacteria group bacterium]
MKKTAVAPSNIAFIKYWGKADDVLRLPLNSSLSMNLSNTSTVTTIEFSSAYKKDDISLLDGTFSSHEIARVILGLNRIRKRADVRLRARVMTKNTFPKGTGAAASASGFAALTVAGFAALGLTLSEKELTIFARMGSGSACRSIPDGYVFWEKGNSSDTSFAYSLYPHTYWNLYDVLVIVDDGMKKISSTKGQEAVHTSPLLEKRLSGIPEKINRTKKAFQEKNFPLLGEIIEDDCLSMHHVMQTQTPPLFYWNEATKKIIKKVRMWRYEGIHVYFTIDAGPNVHLICEKPFVDAIKKKLADVEEVKNIIVNTSTPGAHLIDEHLF